MVENITFTQHIAIKCTIAVYILLRIKHTRQYLMYEACHTLSLGTVISNIDYVNVVFVGLPEVDISKLECIHNTIAKSMLGYQMEDNATECLWQLHGLWIRKRIKHKVLTLVFNMPQGRSSNLSSGSPNITH